VLMMDILPRPAGIVNNSPIGSAPLLATILAGMKQKVAPAV